MSVSDVKAQRDRRRETASHMRAVLDTALDAVISMDATGRVTFWNPRAEQIFGWSREEAVGKPVAELIIPPNKRAAHASGLAHYLRTGEGRLLNRRVEMMAVRRDGSEVPVELVEFVGLDLGGVRFVESVDSRVQIEVVAQPSA